MKLVYWMYTGPAHVGILRVASSFKNVHAIMHAPLGDDYFNVMRSMLERERDFTPVTASIIDRYVLARGSREKVFKNILRKDKEQRPDLIVLTPTCTSSILQEDLQNFVNRASLSARSDVILADVNHYRVNEFQAADRTLEQIVRYYLIKAREQGFFKNQSVTTVPSVNIIGIFTLGFHNQHDSRELKRLLEDLGIKINEIIPEGASVKKLINLPQAWFNIVPYREVGLMTASFLQKDFGMPYILTTPMGIIDTGDFIRQVQKNVNKLAPFFLKKTFNFESYIDYQTKFVSHAAWFSQSTDWQNLTGKKAVVFGDATHAASMTKIMVREMGIHVSCAGTFCKHDSNWFKEQVQDFCDEIIITEDHAEVADTISRLEPAAIFGTQMERHIGKRLGIPCGVISPPVHIQNFPLGYRPFLGFEGTNQIADLVYNSFTLGMEDHLLDVFGGHENKKVLTKLFYKKTKFYWTVESQIELQKIPGFVRDKIKRNIEKFARQKNARTITVDIMYAAKKSFKSNLI